jgi:hypothetical protein
MLAALLVPFHLFAQGLSAGLRVGVPITPELTADSPQQVSTPRFTIGPLVELPLWHGIGFGADFLLRRTGFASPASSSRRADAWLWEAPVALIYRFQAPPHPFVRTGISFNRVFHVGGATRCGRGPFGEQFYCLDGSQAAEIRHRGASGFVAGGGLRFKLPKLSLEPELRVTHWIDRNFGVHNSAVRSNLNEIELLIGVAF